jgi:5-methylcytosine-specific restriction endonuclease McrA
MAVKITNEYRGKVLSFIKKYKLNSGCAHCKENGNADVLDFHHVNPETKVSPINVLVRTSGLLAVLEEMEKCIVLCANCHRKEHNREKTRVKKH